MKTQDIKTLSDELHQSMKEQLEAIALENQDVTTKASKSLLIIKSGLSKLKTFVHQYQFNEKQEEIEFFKEIKPIYASQYYYYERILSLKIDEPIGNHEELLDFYHGELNHIQDFIRQYREFHQYCLTNSTHLDEHYFTREHNSTQSPDVDVKFSTGYDTILAILLANRMLKDYLLSAIKKIGVEADGGSQSLLTWTGPKTALIELIYALQSVEAFNNGKADIKLIASSFESLFNTSLGNYYRVFQEIRIRKNGKTNFLDQLKNKFIQRMDELDQN